MFKIPPRRSEVVELRAEVAALRAEMATLSQMIADIPRPAREAWRRTEAPDLTAPLPYALPVEEQPSAILQLLFSSQRSA